MQYLRVSNVARTPSNISKLLPDTNPPAAQYFFQCPNRIYPILKNTAFTPHYSFD